MSIDYQATYGTVEQRRRYIKARIQSAQMASDHDQLEVWQNTLNELENASRR